MDDFEFQVSAAQNLLRPPRPLCRQYRDSLAGCYRLTDSDDDDPDSESFRVSASDAPSQFVPVFLSGKVAPRRARASLSHAGGIWKPVPVLYPDLSRDILGYPDFRVILF